MRYGIAVWNYKEAGASTPRLVEEFAGWGFDAVSFLLAQTARLDAGEARELASVLDARGLVATLHGNFEVTPADIDRVISLFGERLYSITFDAAQFSDSRGRFFDVPRMAALLGQIEAASRGSRLLFGVEDFPLDTLAVDYYRRELGDLLECPRYGMLVDVGHMNLRRHAEAYFRDLTVAEYLARAPRPIVEVHLHDNRGDRDSHGHFGSGNIRFDEVAAGLRAVGFDGVSTIEIAPSFHGSTPAESKPHARETLARWKELWETR